MGPYGCGGWRLPSGAPHLSPHQLIYLIGFLTHVLGDTLTPDSSNPSAQQTAVYRGATQADVLQQFSKDSQDAQASGFLPIGQEWAEDSGQVVLTVRYAKSAPASTTPAWGNIGTPSAVASALPKKSHKKLWAAGITIAILAVAVASTGADKDRPADTSGAATTESGHDRFVEFSGWVGGDFQSMANDVTTVSAYASAGDMAGTMDAAADMENTATRLIVYLDSHPAATCYAGMQADVRAALTSFRGAGGAASSGDFTSATTMILRGTDYLTTATDAIPTAASACTG
jgi:hypothetical protein